MNVLPIIPLGTILPFAGERGSSLQEKLYQEGYVFCDGSELNRKEYQALFDVIGNSYGDGDSVYTFNIPDMRGLFLRGVDYERGKDPDKEVRTASGKNGKSGNHVGSIQEDGIRSHNHFVGYEHSRSFKGSDDSDKALKSSQGAHYYSHNTGGSETRPVNIYVNYIIKVKNIV